MDGTINSMREAKAWQEKFNPGSPEIGEIAPDFHLYDSQGENPIRLSDFHDQKPVALIFGSFT